MKCRIFVESLQCPLPNAGVYTFRLESTTKTIFFDQTTRGDFRNNFSNPKSTPSSLPLSLQLRSGTGGEPANRVSYKTTSIYEAKGDLPPLLKGG